MDARDIFPRLPKQLSDAVKVLTIALHLTPNPFPSTVPSFADDGLLSYDLIEEAITYISYKYFISSELTIIDLREALGSHDVVIVSGGMNSVYRLLFTLTNDRLCQVRELVRENRLVDSSESLSSRSSTPVDIVNDFPSICIEDRELLLSHTDRHNTIHDALVASFTSVGFGVDGALPSAITKLQNAFSGAHAMTVQTTLLLGLSLILCGRLEEGVSTVKEGFDTALVELDSQKDDYKQTVVYMHLMRDLITLLS